MNLDASEDVNLLKELSRHEFASAEKLLAGMSDLEATHLVIGACQAFDFWLLSDNFSQDANAKLSVPDMSIVSRGWNPLLAILQKRIGKQSGVPMGNVDMSYIQRHTSLLHQLGRGVVLNKTAELLQFGNFESSSSGKDVYVRTTVAESDDLHSDRIDDWKWNNLDINIAQKDAVHQSMAAWRKSGIQQKLTEIVFPYAMPHGTIVGYQTTREIDEHFLSLIAPTISDWQRQSGLLPQANVKGVSGAEIASILSICMSSRLSHTQLVTAGKKKFKDVNYLLSNTIWKAKSEIVSSISEFFDLDPLMVSSVIDRSTFGETPNADLSSDVLPLCPPFMKVSQEFLLLPVSFLFQNPLEMYKRLNDDAPTRAAVKEHREDAMVNEINHLFVGPKYRCLKGRSRLKKEGRTVTDIDAAILDMTIGELALIQLKWQDFVGANNKKQASRAKNFVTQVDNWTAKVHDWISTEGMERLFKSLQLPVVDSSLDKVFTFAIGQQAARFSTFGFPLSDKRTAPATTKQFMRLRFQIGPAENVIQSLFRAIQMETTSLDDIEEIPYTMQTSGYRIHLENMWSSVRQ